MHRPASVAQRLSISPATLRVWSGEFAQFLSQAAQTSLTEAGGRAQRRYTDDDIATLRRAKTLLAGGLTYGQVREALAEPPAAAPASEPATPAPAPAEPPASEAPSAALAIIEQARLAMVSMQQTIEAQAAHLQPLPRPSRIHILPVPSIPRHPHLIYQIGRPGIGREWVRLALTGAGRY